jgi:amylosucrase
MHNPSNGDGRITGSCASLSGLEKAIQLQHPEAIEQAIQKILMLHGIILSFGGIPLIYAGDELGTLNDYSYLNDDHKKYDSRWVNRPSQNWSTVAQLKDDDRPASIIFNGLKEMIALRKKINLFSDSNNVVLHDAQNPHLFLYERVGKKKEGVLILANFDEHSQIIDANLLLSLGYLKDGVLHDLRTNKKRTLSSGLVEVQPYQLLWLAKP